MINTAEIRLTIESFEPNQTYSELLQEVTRRVLRKQVTKDEGIELASKISAAYTKVLESITVRRVAVDH